MTDPIRLPHSDPDEPRAEAMAYVHLDLSPAERAAFEAHLPTCEACQKAVETERKLAPALERLMAADWPRKSGKDYLAMVDAAQAKLDAEAAAKAARQIWPVRKSWVPYWPWLIAAGTAATVAVVAIVGVGGAAVEPAMYATAEAAGSGKSEFAPSRPGPVHERPKELAVTASVTPRLLWRGPFVDLRAAREAGDRYTAIALFDAHRQLWRVRSSTKPDPSCANGCGPVELRIALGRLPEGPVTVTVLAGPEPFSEDSFENDLERQPSDLPPDVGERAAGRALFKR